MVPVRVFSPRGIGTFGRALDAMRDGEQIDVVAMRDDQALTETVPGGPGVDVRPFRDRFEAGKYFYELLEPHAAELGDIERNAGLWSWLALCWIDVLAPVGSDGSRPLREQARWIAFVDNYKRYYRHLLAGPYRIYKAHRDDPEVAMAVLATPVNRFGEVVEQFASRQEFIVNRNLLSAITKLYYDPSAHAIKRGAAGKGGGSARRLADVLNQFDLTWDIHGMPSDELLGLLPNEFARFRQS